MLMGMAKFWQSMASKSLACDVVETSLPDNASITLLAVIGHRVSSIRLSFADVVSGKSEKTQALMSSINLKQIFYN